VSTWHEKDRNEIQDWQYKEAVLYAVKHSESSHLGGVRELQGKRKSPFAMAGEGGFFCQRSVRDSAAKAV